MQAILRTQSRSMNYEKKGGGEETDMNNLIRYIVVRMSDNRDGKVACTFLRWRA